MRVEVYMNSTYRERERDVLRCMYNGIKRDLYPDNTSPEMEKMIRNFNKAQGRGTGVELSYDEKGRGKNDVGVIFGSWKPERSNPHHKIRSAVAEQDSPFICIETQLLGRCMFQESEYHRVGINGFLNQQGIFGVEQDYDSRRFKKLGLNYNGWQKSRGDKIVVALQLPGDASLRGMDINEWAIWILEKLRGNTDRPIEIRTHPGVSQKGIDSYLPLFQYLAFTSDLKNTKVINGKDVPWEEQILDAHCVVSFTSGLSTDAILNGIPVVACDPGNFAWSISSQNIKEIENPFLADEDTVRDWLNTLAYCQWSKEEMESGECWHHLKPVLLELTSKKEINEDGS